MAYPPRTPDWPKLGTLPLPAKVLATAVLVSMAVALVGALGQIVVHDIIPTFFADAEVAPSPPPVAPEGRGDLLGDLSAEPAAAPDEPLHRSKQFVWLLKWTHIHLFGMFMIFIFVGTVAIFLDLGATLRGWLVALPFIGVLIDISGMWLKAYLSPAFFWLHVPGGGLFVLVFGVVFFRALYEMWAQDRPGRQ